MDFVTFENSFHCYSSGAYILMQCRVSVTMRDINVSKTVVCKKWVPIGDFITNINATCFHCYKINKIIMWPFFITKWKFMKAQKPLKEIICPSVELRLAPRWLGVSPAERGPHVEGLQQRTPHSHVFSVTHMLFDSHLWLTIMKTGSLHHVTTEI